MLCVCPNAFFTLPPTTAGFANFRCGNGTVFYGLAIYSDISEVCQFGVGKKGSEFCNFQLWVSVCSDDVKLRVFAAEYVLDFVNNSTFIQIV